MLKPFVLNWWGMGNRDMSVERIESLLHNHTYKLITVEIQMSYISLVTS